MINPFLIALFPTLLEEEMAHVMGKGPYKDYSFHEAKKLKEKLTMCTHLLSGITGLGRVTYGKWPVVD